MKKPTFLETGTELIDAYKHHRIRYASCGACAVANIIANANHMSLHLQMLMLGWYTMRNLPHMVKDIPEVRKTGYTPLELSMVERAFEAEGGITSKVYDGVMAAIDALAVIHDASPDEIWKVKNMTARIY